MIGRRTIAAFVRACRPTRKAIVHASVRAIIGAALTFFGYPVTGHIVLVLAAVVLVASIESRIVDQMLATREDIRRWRSFSKRLSQ